MFLKKSNYILNRLLIIVPLLLILLPFINGVGCNTRLKGQAVQPQREVQMTCSNGVYDIYNYFPDGSIRIHKGLFGYLMGTGLLIKFSHEYLNFNLSVDTLKKDVINQSGHLFILKFKKVDDENINVDYLHDMTGAGNDVRIKALYSGELGFIE